MCCCLYIPSAGADGGDKFQYDLWIIIERSEHDGLTLASDPSQDRLVETENEIELGLSYQAREDLLLFFRGSLISQSETLENTNTHLTASGFERKELGFTLEFGDTIDSLLIVGRQNFSSTSNTWLWWDEELDAIRLETAYKEFSSMLALAEEQAPESTYIDFIAPEHNDVRRIIANLAWLIEENHLIQFYYLDQNDNSSSHSVGDSIEYDRADEEDADLRWAGINYLGEFALDGIGEISLDLNLARVSGMETVYEFSDPTGNITTVDNITTNQVEGTAQGLALSWTPTGFDDWLLLLGHARGSGDSNPGDGKITAYRQTGLQGDAEVFGELYQPELSNLIVGSLGISYQGFEGIDISLLAFNYRQDELAQQMRDVSIDLDTTGLNRDLGGEIDLVINIEAFDGFEVELIVARFEAGKAYGSEQGKTSSYWFLGVGYEF